ncbi:MAG: hypothetical protein IJG38_07840 [Thermoguttaceae bacterium]|jgi:hypothetical protein|nr:hypothetical protein [Thermoguttaceae bacterium]MBQ6616244.1 hypothetical protein [Thermoguttaceae bacterium]
MMNYAQVVYQAEQMGCSQEEARAFARKVITTAALLAVMPEDVLQTWYERNGEKIEGVQPVPELTKTRVMNALTELVV